MTVDQIFSIVNSAALLPWLLMILLPKWKFTHFIIHRFVFSIIFSTLYLGLLFFYFGKMGMGSFSSLVGVTELFSHKELVLIGWVHYLAFDLLVGSWEFRDAPKSGIPHLFLVPCLFFTLILGPVGFLMYLIIRFFKKKNN